MEFPVRKRKISEFGTCIYTTASNLNLNLRIREHRFRSLEDGLSRSVYVDMASVVYWDTST